MDKQDIIRMARESGAMFTELPMMDAWVFDDDMIERFADLVAAAERESCAKVCENGVDTEHPTVKGHIMKNFGVSRHLAAAIRATGNT